MSILKKKVGMIIQARMGSKRLPGKSMFDLAGEPLVGRILERVKRCNNLNIIVLAVPNLKKDDILVKLGKKYKVTVFRGSETNLLERYYYAAKDNNISTIVRLPGDNPTPEPSEIDKIIDYHKIFNNDGFTTNLCEINNSGYPDGIGAEVFGFNLLKDLFKGNQKCLSYEHIHENFIDYKKSKAVDETWCQIATMKCNSKFSRPDIVLDVNTIEQYNYMKKLYSDLYPKSNQFSITDIIKWHDELKIVREDNL